MYNHDINIGNWRKHQLITEIHRLRKENDVLVAALAKLCEPKITIIPQELTGPYWQIHPQTIPWERPCVWCGVVNCGITHVICDGTK